MRIHWRVSAVVVLAVVLAAAPMCMAAEPYVRLFVGAAIPQDSNVDQPVFGPVTFKDVGFDTPILFGGRAGSFFDTPVSGARSLTPVGWAT